MPLVVRVFPLNTYEPQATTVSFVFTALLIVKFNVMILSQPVTLVKVSV